MFCCLSFALKLEKNTEIFWNVMSSIMYGLAGWCYLLRILFIIQSERNASLSRKGITFAVRSRLKICVDCIAPRAILRHLYWTRSSLTNIFGSQFKSNGTIYSSFGLTTPKYSNIKQLVSNPHVTPHKDHMTFKNPKHFFTVESMCIFNFKLLWKVNPKKLKNLTYSILRP